MLWRDVCVMVVMGAKVIAARDVRKARTRGLDAFDGFPRPSIALVTPSALEWFGAPWRVDEAAQFGAQLPTLIRGIYYEGWDPSKTPVIERSPDGFIERVQAAFQADPMDDAEHAIAAVIDVLDAHISEGQMDNVKHTFTKKIHP